MMLAGVLALVAGLAGGVSAEPGISDVKKEASALVKKLLPALSDKAGKIGVLTFSPIDDGTKTSPFGRLVQEQVTLELSQRRPKTARYLVLERREIYKLMEDSRTYGKDEDLFDKLREKGGLDYMVSGTYGATDKEVTVTASLLETKSAAVLASASFVMDNGKSLSAMMTAPEAKKEKEEPLALEAALVFAGADGKLHAVREGATMTSKDNYALYLKPAQDCWIYIYQTDSAGNTLRLFPNDDFKTAANPLSAGREYWAPNDGDYYFLDENKGKETIYVVASRKPKPALEELVSAKQEAFLKKVDELKLMGAAGRRSVSIVKAKPLRGAEADIISKRLGAAGDFVFAVSFRHD